MELHMPDLQLVGLCGCGRGVSAGVLCVAARWTWYRLLLKVEGVASRGLHEV